MSENLRQQLELVPDLLAEHVALSVSALAIGAGVAMPLAFFCLRRPKVRAVSLAVASVMQTVPSLAMLALMVAAFSLFGFPAALIALSLYAILPILRNTVTGLDGVDPAITEAARGMGMTQRQVLTRVRLPIALPVIVAGVRTATVWIVGIATLSTPVGADSLGNFIFSGLQTRNFTAVLTGVVAAAALAIALDGLIRQMERAATERSAARGGVTGALLLVVLVGPLLVDALWRPGVTRAEGGEEAARGERGSLVVGAKTFSEQFILARLIRDRLEREGFEVTLREGLGSTIAFEALTQGRIDVYVDYSGTIWANHMEGGEITASDPVLFLMTAWLAESEGVTCLGSLGFENAYALAMREEAAKELGVREIPDLTPHAEDLSIGGDYEFFARPEWDAFRRAYGLRFADQRSFDSTIMYPAVAQGDVDLITAFSTDARIDAYDLRLIEDTKGVFPPYDAVLLLAPGAAERPGVVEALAPLIGSIDGATMRRANGIVDLDGRTPAAAAEWLGERVGAAR